MEEADIVEGRKRKHNILLSTDKEERGIRKVRRTGMEQCDGMVNDRWEPKYTDIVVGWMSGR